jgi:hypothetical protein
MRRKREKKYQTLGDYVTMAISPVLIMILVGSLVFFLAEVFYVGEYSGRLVWTLFWFVVGMVLIARIHIENNDGRWKFYGVGLGLTVYAALVAYIAPGPILEFRWLVNFGLVAVIWWATHRLTWDSTYIDDQVDASGMGVLEAAGLDQAAASPEGLARSGIEESGQPARSADSATTAQASENPGWWARYRLFRKEQAKKPHTPGVWIVYFSLAALPIFGLGQVLIPEGELERRRHVFWLFAAYVGSGLGLLLTTSYLGLRRYLRQRKLAMPVAMTGVWLSVGGTMIVILLLFGALLPRPFGEYQLFNFTPLGSPEREASRFAMKGDSKAKGEGRGSSEFSERDPSAKSSAGNQSDKQAQTDSSSRSSGSQSGGQRSGNRGNSQGKQGESSSDSKQSSDRADGQKDGERRDDAGQRDDQRKDNQDGNRDRTKAEQKDNGSSKRVSGEGKTTQSGSSSSSRPQPSSSASGFLSKLGWLANLLKWILFGILVLVVGFYVLRSALRFLANFTGWAKKLLESLQAFWASLFGGSPTAEASVADSNPEERISKPRPFSLFRDPFLTGKADEMSPNQVVRYSFEALQSWAWERSLGRNQADTPREFVDRLVAEVPGLDREARGLAALYARVAYARSNLGPGALDPLRSFWHKLHELSERPLSA